MPMLAALSVRRDRRQNAQELGIPEMPALEHRWNTSLEKPGVVRSVEELARLRPALFILQMPISPEGEGLTRNEGVRGSSPRVGSLSSEAVFPARCAFFLEGPEGHQEPLKVVRGRTLPHACHTATPDGGRPFGARSSDCRHGETLRGRSVIEAGGAATTGSGEPERQLGVVGHIVARAQGFSLQASSAASSRSTSSIHCL
jgi:hypothetical protein